MKVPFPYFGGKSTVAHIVWSALGDVGHYIEPFAGSAAVLLNRPDYDPQQHVETINDADAMIANVWRAIRQDPDGVARYCDWPVSHVDLMARKKKLNARYAELTERCWADDLYYDTELAGLYVWAASCWIGRGLISPGQRPHLARGRCVHAKGQIPNLAVGQGVHAKGQIPHLADGTGRALGDPYNPNLYAWMRALAERLRYVRTICGDWRRVCRGNWKTHPGRPCGVFFDPPYSDVAERDSKIYTQDSDSVAHEVRAWCRGRADDRDYRIVLAGYYEEHESLLAEGWSVHRWKAQGGYSNQRRGQKSENRHREALFFSPHCLPIAKARQEQQALWPMAAE